MFVVETRVFLWDDGIAKTLLTSRDCDVDNFDRARRLKTEPPRKLLGRWPVRPGGSYDVKRAAATYK
eukprot:scaffold3546_cov66-Phaeocystis_antarctica.AAC.3